MTLIVGHLINLFECNFTTINYQKIIYLKLCLILKKKIVLSTSFNVNCNLLIFFYFFFYWTYEIKYLILLDKSN